MNSTTNEVPTEPRLERRTRRRFSAQEKVDLLNEFDELPRGGKGAWLRRQGLYAGQLSNWRKQLAESGTEGLEPKKAGRKPKDERDRRIEALERENRRLNKRIEVAEGLVELQKKWSELLGDETNGSSR